MRLNKINMLNFGSYYTQGKQLQKKQEEDKQSATPLKPVTSEIKTDKIEFELRPTNDIKTYQFKKDDPIERLQHEKQENQIAFMNLVNSPQKYRK